MLVEVEQHGQTRRREAARLEDHGPEQFGRRQDHNGRRPHRSDRTGGEHQQHVPAGIKAGIGLAAKDGIDIKYVTADTTTTPTGVLTAAQRLVTEDHVYAVIASSVLLFAAAKYLAEHGVPVFGPGADGDEWITTPSMFSIIGYQDYTKVYTMFGDFYKAHGVTNLGVVGYSIEPSSKESAEDVAASAKNAGITIGYQNYQFPLGSTNVEPIVLAMKAAGIRRAEHLYRHQQQPGDRHRPQPARHPSGKRPGHGLRR